MILALELCEEIVVYGMVSDNYCRSGQPGPGRPGGELGRLGPLCASGWRIWALWGAGRVGFRVGV